ncbi:MAG: XRE family transcriptional regulator [Eubacteriales bacterium]|jgi:repressor LexA|nr:XRE family transcriptional regulator [Eubacteriales bacterium]
MSDNTTLGSRIRSAREHSGMYQHQLAALLDLTSGRIISNWENDIARPDTDNIVKLCKVLNVSASYLIGYYGNIPGVDEQINTEEYMLIKDYRLLDEHGKSLVSLVVNKEKEWILQSQKNDHSKYRRISYYDYAASAGTGLFLEDVKNEFIRIPLNTETENADYVIPVSGDSMEPMLYNGDLICVKIQPVVNEGEIGIFLINGEAFIKKYLKNRLVSLNPKYDDILLNKHDSVFCKGRVLCKINDVR